MRQKQKEKRPHVDKNEDRQIKCEQKKIECLKSLFFLSKKSDVWISRRTYPHQKSTESKEFTADYYKKSTIYPQDIHFLWINIDAPITFYKIGG